MMSIFLAAFGGFIIGAVVGVWFTCRALDKVFAPHIEAIDKILERNQ